MLEVQHHSVLGVLALDEEVVQLTPDHSADDRPHLLPVCFKAEALIPPSCRTRAGLEAISTEIV